MDDQTVLMREPLRSEVIARLEDDMEFESEPRGKYLRRGRCPACDKREMFVVADGPWRLQCGRLNKCGATYHIKELFQDLFDTWTNRYGRVAREKAQTEGRAIDAPGSDPKSFVADAYLEVGRGFDLGLVKGWYTEEHYYDEAIDAGTTTVRFSLPNGFWERFLDKPDRFGKQKGRAVGRYKGLWWQAPGQDLTEVDELWVVEGIFDAIALMHAGVDAVSSVSCSNFPAEALADLGADCQEKGRKTPLLVFAYDGDRAGTRYTRRHIQAAREKGWKCAAAVIPVERRAKRLDWNDTWQRGELTEEKIEEYRYHGSLLTARSAKEKGRLISERRNQMEFWFEFGNRIYWFAVDRKRYEQELKTIGYEGTNDIPTPDDRNQATRKASLIQKIANCHPQALYYLSNRVTDEAWYYWSVDFPGDQVKAKNTFTGQQLASSSEFKKRLLHIAPGAIWEGTNQQLDRLLSDQISHIKQIATIDFIGYSKEHDCWLWGDVAVREGKIHNINEEDYFDFGRMSLKTLAQSPALSINTDRDDYTTAWAKTIWQAFGTRGVVCVAFWLGSLFAEQIRQRTKSFPFLEIVGEAGSGKSTLIEFLWKLVGRRDYEGFDPAKSTRPGRARNFAQVGGMPVVLIESDREQMPGVRQKNFEWDELKTLYNGRSVRARGMMNSGNDTYEPPFRGSIVISQNAPVEASEAIMQRIVDTTFSRDTHTDETKRLAEELERIPLEQVSGFALHATKRAKKLLEVFDRYAPMHEEEIARMDRVRVRRIAKNHAQVVALVYCLGTDGLGLLPDNAIADTVNEIYAMAERRQVTIDADHPVVQEFWEAVDYVEGLRDTEAMIDHYGRKEREIAINLTHFEAVTADLKVRIPAKQELKRYLKTSKGRPFIEANRTVSSRIFGKTARCWIFERREPPREDD